MAEVRVVAFALLLGREQDPASIHRGSRGVHISGRNGQCHQDSVLHGLRGKAGPKPG
jgi:hypothetical protein